LALKSPDNLRAWRDASAIVCPAEKPAGRAARKAQAAALNEAKRFFGHWADYIIELDRRTP
jgi:hypothetical protein